MIKDHDTIKDTEEQGLVYIYHQNLTGMILKNCPLIDSECSVDILNNVKYLTNIHKVKKPLNLQCNAGCA